MDQLPKGEGCDMGGFDGHRFCDRASFYTYIGIERIREGGPGEDGKLRIGCELFSETYRGVACRVCSETRTMPLP